jgi:hypothetical protein
MGRVKEWVMEHAWLIAYEYPTPADMATFCDGCGDRLAASRIEVAALGVVCSQACEIALRRFGAGLPVTRKLCHSHD